MKKVLLVLLVGMFWCNVGFAITQQSAIEDCLSDHKLENIEGIWIESSGTVYAVYKSGTSSPTYVSKFIGGDKNIGGWWLLEKGSSKLFYGKSVNSYKAFANVSVEVTKNKFRLSYSNGKQSAKTFPTISWPVKFQKGRFN